MKTAIIALCAATLIAAAPVFAQSVLSKAPGHQMRATAKHAHPGASGYAAGRKMQARKGYPGVFGYAPSATRDITDISTQAGGGSGGGM